MNKKTLFSLLIAVIALTSGFVSCKGKAKGGGTLNIRISADPDKLNPITLTTNDGRRIADLMFAALNGSKPVSDFGLTPYIIKENAKISEITDGEFKGGLKLDYEIREDAKWDNGTPITADDYAFTIKAILNPKVNCEPLRGYYSWLADVVLDPSNPKKFSVIANKKYYMIEEFAGGYVLPEYNYDPDKIMRKFTVKDMNTDTKRSSLRENADIIKFAELFNSEKFQRDPKFIVGAGPYRLESWTTGQEVVLVKKDSWWGNAHADDRTFWAFPKRIKVKVINDDNTAMTAMKDGAIDNFTAIRAKDFKELEKNESFKSKFNLDKIGRLSYGFLGLNLRNEKFQDIKVRKALAHAVNRDKINQIISFGESTKTESFAHSTQPHYNKNLKEYEFNLDQAAKLLDEAGWKDTDGDGLRDKVLSGKKTQLIIEYKIPKDESAKNQGLILQEDFKKVGIDLKIVEKEWTIMVAELDKHQFEMYAMGFTISPKMSDPKQQWHTSSAVPGGSNNVGWGDAASDKLIEDIGAELNLEKRQELNKQLQQRVHDELPVIFMFNGVNRIASNKKFEIENIMISPGVLYNEFKSIK
jgi:peptide/nickel transport system substrate-binding protein